MSKAGLTRRPASLPAKCADLLSYLWAEQFFEDAGIAAGRPQRVSVAEALRVLP